jgi:hypothetical protein
LVSDLDLTRRIGNDTDSIFFIETNSRLQSFHGRLLCAFESAALQNPGKEAS